MITKDNLKEVLKFLNFKQDSTRGGGLWSKNINSYTMQVDFTNKKLIYPKSVKINDVTTSNFSHPENFVVFECVHRLLEKGYKAESLELEPKWKLGREAKSGKADILVRDHKKVPYLLIECKTAGGEFSKEWGRMQNNGGQLFSYFQQEKATKFLCLYTSDLEKDDQESKSIKYQNYIINMQDNEAALAQSKKQGYKDANSNKEVFQVWSDTYAKEYEKSGIFEDEIALYNITKLKPKLDNLKPMSQSEIQKKRHEWATILRANAVGDRSLALNGLMNLFLCKITDELENANDLQFSWRGYSRDSAFDLVDRLQKLYKIGMEKYLNQTITYHSKDSIEEAFTSAFEGIIVKEKIQNIFNELKYFSNGDFNFIEVYNEDLFYKNFKILLPIVLKLEDTAFTKNADSNILGDYFESYIHDMPQQEGQYFTPVPLVNFIIHSLPVFKNASVLDFSCGAGHFLTQYAEINKPYKKAKFLGQDKDPRLAKIAKIASFMHQSDMEILANDSFECGIDDSKFNVLISNPPYSVDGFLNVLSDDIRKSYKLFSDKLNIESNNAIECFFIEKASKALRDNGLLSLVLPNSLINKDSIYKATRELLLRDFYIIALVSLGNQTFFKTGTNPIILFALRKAKNTNTKTTQNDLYKDFYKHIVENKLSAILQAYESEFLALLQAYCTFRAYDKDEFLALLKLNLQEDSTLYTNELFKEYANAYKALIQKEKDEYHKKSDKYKAQNPFTPSQSKEEFIRKLEAEKFLYFCYSLDSNPLIIKAPSDIKEQKKFLGYFWSNTKGKQGIQYLTTSGINAISEILTPLYNPKNRFDSSKLSFYIMQEYLNKLHLKFLDHHFQKDLAKEQEIPQDLAPYACRARLIDMLDFSKVDFNKAISLNPINSQGAKNPFENCKFELVKISEIILENPKSKIQVKDAKENTTGAYPFYTSGTNIYRYDKALISGENIYLSTGGNAIVQFYNGESAYSTDTYAIKANAKMLTKFLFYVLQTLQEHINQFLFKGIGLKHLQKKDFKNLKIPLPPLEIQAQIVEECEKVDEQYNTIKMSVEKYQELIKAILIKCGICADEEGGGNKDLIASLIKAIQELESKLNFDTLWDNELPQSLMASNKQNSLTDDLKALLISLPTPPPQGWGTKKLQEIANISRGASPRPINEFLTQDSNGVNWIKIGDVADNAKYITQTKEKITPQGAEKSKFVKAGDFILSNSMSIGRPYILKINGCIHDGWLLLSNINKTINKEFLYYALTSSDTQKQFKQKASGMVVKNLNIDLVKKVKIPLPPLDTQEKIVLAISRVENKITAINSKLENLEARKAEILNNALRGDSEREREREQTELKLILSKIQALLLQKKLLQSFITKILQKTGLAQSLETLIASIPTPPSTGYERVRLEKMLLEPKLNNIKIPKNDFLDKGSYPIISQENEIINGWTNLENPITDLPLIVFGDHSCTFKFIDFPFFRGADGTQILKFKNELNAKLAFYILKESQIPNQEKYERHFKYLKTTKIPLPPLKAQEKIVSVIQNLEDKISFLENLNKNQNSKKTTILQNALS